MITKSIIALSAILVVSTSVSAFAYEAPENKLGDRYPFLEQMYTPVAANTLRSRILMVKQVSSFVQYTYEAPENKIGDRYPFLEQVAKPITVEKFAGRYLTSRMASRMDSNPSQNTYEAPENKIGDRYPVLEQQYASQRGPARPTYVTARRNVPLSTGSIR